MLVVSTSVDSCARSLRQPVQAPQHVVSDLWREPVDLESRDLFHGPGGASLTPPPVTYTFVARKSTGTNPGYDVRDPQGRLWSVKLGDEAQSEVTVGRILWALGFHQPPTYFVQSWQMSGEDGGNQPAARFRPEREEQAVTGDWSWYDNPFVGSRPFSALIAVNLLLKNWDLKTTNNKVYGVRNEDGVVERWYVVRDLGASLGKARQPRFLSWFPFMRQKQGSKNSLDDFEAQGFVRSVEDGKVNFDYRGLDRRLAGSVTVDDLRWTCALVSRLSQEQWLAAFRAGGFSDEQGARYVAHIRQQITQAESIVSRSNQAAN